MLSQKMAKQSTKKLNASYKLHFKKLLENQKADIEKQLKSFATKDERLGGDYDTKFPDLGTHQSSDELAQEVSLYESRLPVEFTLEDKLQAINAALAKIELAGIGLAGTEKNRYGVCENCGKPIDRKRLEAKPEAKYCVKCKDKINPKSQWPMTTAV
jgi:RNA polymerase-binding transcription factor DksA